MEKIEILSKKSPFKLKKVNTVVYNVILNLALYA